MLLVEAADLVVEVVVVEGVVVEVEAEAVEEEVEVTLQIPQTRKKQQIIIIIIMTIQLRRRPRSITLTGHNVRKRKLPMYSTNLAAVDVDGVVEDDLAAVAEVVEVEEVDTAVEEDITDTRTINPIIQQKHNNNKEFMMMMMKILQITWLKTTTLLTKRRLHLILQVIRASRINLLQRHT